MDAGKVQRDIWRPSFDEVTRNGFLCFRAGDAPAQPLTEQLRYELKRLFTSPCDFSQGSETWEELFAASSVPCIRAVVLLGLRFLCAIVHTVIICIAVARGWRMIYFYTTWTNLLIIVYYAGATLSSGVALFVDRSPVNRRLTEDDLQLEYSADRGQLPVLLRLLESVSSIVVGSSFVTCIVYWVVLLNLGESHHWTTYYEHVSFVPVFIVVALSRVPYRLQHMWIPLCIVTAYCVLSIIIAYVPLTTFNNQVGFVYHILRYRENPCKAWIVTFLFIFVLTPVTYLLFWFLLRFNNPRPLTA